uniref:telomere repeat-binding factor 1-like n=1 Tax=Erigeron canadensis TaxID=72917 RepID=UPI001CB8A545|nr:telomere repeat-binding factor 1-like [Erigeron canadensis]
MSVPKRKWSLEEEAALKAAVVKYGIGKWVAILKDPNFGSVLHLRSKVDLKDKWRNMRSRMAGGFQACQRVKPWIPTTLPTENCGNITSAPKEDFMKTDPSTTLALSLQNRTSKLPMPRLDTLILDTIDTLKESIGSTPTAIAKNITENYLVPSNLNKLLKRELEALIDCGILKKVRHRYRLTPSSYSDKNPSTLLLEVEQECCLSGTKILTKADIDAELEKMRIMTPRQAAAMAVKVVAEAEAALLEAEKAAREAEVAEADAESAKAFAAAAMRAVKQTALCI